MSTFNTTQYEFAHGKKPSGHGYWGFKPLGARTPEPFVSGTYAQAKKIVTVEFPHITDWVVLS